MVWDKLSPQKLPSALSPQHKNTTNNPENVFLRRLTALFPPEAVVVLSPFITNYTTTTTAMNRRASAVDAAFNSLNASFDKIDISQGEENDEDGVEEDFVLPTLPTSGMDWKTVLMGELDNRQHMRDRQAAEAASKERRAMRALQKQVERERRMKEKAQRHKIRLYLKKKKALRDFETSTKMRRKPIR